MTTSIDSNIYLSRLILNPRSRRVMSELAHPYEMHRTLMHAFPSVSANQTAKARKEFGVLFRADTDEPGCRVIVYVQSCAKPDWSFLKSLPDYLCADVDSPKDITEIYRRLKEGQVLSFHLRANPTRRVWNSKPNTGTTRGQRVALCTEQEQIKWLIRKSRERISEESRCKEPSGFELVMMKCEDDDGQIRDVPRVNVCVEGMQTGRKKENDRNCAMKHFAVRFDGLLRITDSDQLFKTLISGIGSAKAFGFGLLSLAPAQ